MKFSIAKTDLQDLLQGVASAVPTKSTLPILSNVLLEADAEGLTLVATDLDLSIKTRGEAEVTETGTITVPAKKLTEIVRELPSGSRVSVEVSGTRVKIKYEQGSSTIHGMDPEDFPQLPQIDAEKMVLLPTAILEKGVRRTAYAVSNDETRQMLTGVLVQLKAGELGLVATDGHRLARATFRGDYKELAGRDLIVPKKALDQVVRLAAGEETVRITVSKNFVVFEFGSTTVYSRLIDGSFPNYEQVIPKQSARKIAVGREEFMGALRRVSVLSDTMTKQIKLHLKPERMELSVNTADVGEGHEAVPVDYSGEELAIGYNAAYLLEALKTIETDRIQIQLNTPTSPGLFVPEKQEPEEDLLCLVMPLRLPDA